MGNARRCSCRELNFPDLVGASPEPLEFDGGLVPMAAECPFGVWPFNRGRLPCIRLDCGESSTSTQGIWPRCFLGESKFLCLVAFLLLRIRILAIYERGLWQRRCAKQSTYENWVTFVVVVPPRQSVTCSVVGNSHLCKYFQQDDTLRLLLYTH